MGKRSKETNRLSRRVLGMALASSMAFAFLPVAGAADGPEGAGGPAPFLCPPFLSAKLV